MASRQCVYTSEEVLDEAFADGDSEYDENKEEGDSYDPNSSEESLEEENVNDHEEEPSEDEDIFKPQFILVYTVAMILLHKTIYIGHFYCKNPSWPPVSWVSIPGREGVKRASNTNP